MIKVSLLFGLRLVAFFLSTSAFAEDSQMPISDEETSIFSDIGFSVGSSLVFERANEAWTGRLRAPPAFGLQTRLGFLWARLEYTYDTSADTSGAVSVTRTREHLTLWTLFPVFPEDSAIALGQMQIGLGLSGVRNRPTTQIVGVGSESPSVQFAPGYAVSLGFQKRASTWLALRTDLRFESSAQFKAEDGRWGVMVAAELFPFSLGSTASHSQSNH